PIPGIHNRGSKSGIRFFFDQTGCFQVSTNGISFQVYGGSNVMGGKMVGSAQLNAAIIGRRPNPYGLPIDERASLPDANMSPVLDIGGGLFKGQILDPPKDVEITDGCSRVTFVRETIHSNFLRGLEGNGVRNQPLCLLKALCHLLFAPDKEQVDRVTCCPG